MAISFLMCHRFLIRTCLCNHCYKIRRHEMNLATILSIGQLKSIKIRRVKFSLETNTNKMIVFYRYCFQLDFLTKYQKIKHNFFVKLNGNKFFTFWRVTNKILRSHCVSLLAIFGKSKKQNFKSVKFVPIVHSLRVVWYRHHQNVGHGEGAEWLVLQAFEGLRGFYGHYSLCWEAQNCGRDPLVWET